MSSKENINLKTTKTVWKPLKLRINHLEKNKIDKESIKKNSEEFVRNHKSMLKTQQRFKS